MKKALMAVLLLLLIPVCRAEIEYALQGDVRVYAAGKKVGLENAQGEILCQPKYDYIEAFLNRDCAVAHIGEKAGVIARDGHEIIPVEWGSITLSDDGAVAECQVFSQNDIYIISTSTGETLLASSKTISLQIKGNRIIAFSHHRKGYYRPPFKTTVYDTEMQPLFSMDAYISDLGEYYRAEFNDGSYGIVSREGEILVNGLAEITRSADEHIKYYRKTYTHETQLEAWIDAVGTMLDRTRYKNNGKYRNRNCLEWALYRIGFVTRPRTLEAQYVGIIDMDGNRFECTGDIYEEFMHSGKISPAGDGLYLVRIRAGEAHGWIYIDEQGKQVVPGMYDMAYAFVDGTAVVYDDGLYRLIDKNGQKIGIISWGGSFWDKGLPMSFEQSVIPVFISQGTFRFINRKGEFVDGAVYRNIEWDDHGLFKVYTYDGKAMYFDGEMKNPFGKVWDGFEFVSHNDTNGMWVRKNNLIYHIDPETGEQTHEQGYTAIRHNSACLPDGMGWVVIDEMGNPVGPYS